MELSTYALGYTARQQGLKQEANPFPQVGEWHQNWLRGWQHADEDLVPKRKPHAKFIALKEVKEINRESNKNP